MGWVGLLGGCSRSRKWENEARGTLGPRLQLRRLGVRSGSILSALDDLSCPVRVEAVRSPAVRRRCGADVRSRRRCGWIGRRARSRSALRDRLGLRLLFAGVVLRRRADLPCIEEGRHSVRSDSQGFLNEGELRTVRSRLPFSDKEVGRECLVSDVWSGVPLRCDSMTAVQLGVHWLVARTFYRHQDHQLGKLASGIPTIGEVLEHLHLRSDSRMPRAEKARQLLMVLYPDRLRGGVTHEKLEG